MGWCLSAIGVVGLLVEGSMVVVNERAGVSVAPLELGLNPYHTTPELERSGVGQLARLYSCRGLSGVHYTISTLA